MLALTRRVGQAVRIGPDIEVRVIRIDGDRVVLGFEARRDVPIVRSEMLSEVADELQRASDEREQLRRLLIPKG